jgi:Fur family ferric uptake transcriptional regulator
LNKQKPQKRDFDVNTWKAKIREVNLRVTGGRLAVLRIVAHSQAPLRHSGLVMARDGEPHDRATIFRNLNDSTDIGLIEKKDFGHHTWRFEIKKEWPGTGGAGHTIEHPHFT